MRRNMVETVLGAIVLLVAAVFVVFAVQTGDVGTVDGYRLTANFLKAGGLETGNDVRIAGVKVGTVTDRKLDAENFEAIIGFTVHPELSLSDDTAAIVTSDGILGGKYLRLLPGSSSKKIAPGGVIADARDYETLEDQVSKIIFLATGSEDAASR
ncbi:MAG: MlaD family protein [Alphaproteobacteria bacterium]|jgi:phospholipid/cholesterol/gamma-HCH transport system substrate-binding protein